MAYEKMRLSSLGGRKIMKNNNVSFDGKDLTFFVDNVKITNGKLSDSFELNSEYTITKESLGLLIAALTDSSCVMEAENAVGYCEPNGFCISRRAIIHSRKSLDKELIRYNKNLFDSNEKLSGSNKELEERVKRLNKALGEIRRMNDNLSNAIYRHNKSSWFDRMRKIEIHEEQIEL